MPLRAIDDGLWCADGEVRFVGQRVPARMTVLRLEDGGLILYSPLKLVPELHDEVARLGRIDHLVAPSKYHHLWFGDWSRACPEARTYGAPGLSQKRRDLHFDEELADVAPAAWRAELDQLVFRGMPVFNEVELLHRATGTLLLCDLAFNIQAADGGLAPLILRLNGMWRRFGPSRALSLMMRANRAGARAGLATLLAWDFERVVPAHGEILEHGGREALREAFRFLA